MAAASPIQSLIYHTIPEYTDPYYTIPDYTAPYFTFPDYTDTHYTIPDYTDTYYTIPDYTAPYYTIPDYQDTYNIMPYYTDTYYTIQDLSDAYHTIPDYTGCQKNVTSLVFYQTPPWTPPPPLFVFFDQKIKKITCFLSLLKPKPILTLFSPKIEVWFFTTLSDPPLFGKRPDFLGFYFLR